MKKVCTIGGGTGNFVVLSGLKEYDVDLSAVVAMADDGGSTGILRDELGVLPAGDVRQCIVALSNSSQLMRNLMNYRFDRGGLRGHSFGNLFLSALEKVTGSFERSIEEVGKVLNISGKIFPVTMQQVRLMMILQDGEILEGEKEIYLSHQIDKGYKKIYLEPYPKVNPQVIEAIESADVVVLGPGGLYCSLISNLLVDGVKEVFLRSKAKKVYVMNLMNQKGQTTDFTAKSYLDELVKFIGKDIFDFIIVNDQKPGGALLNAYKDEGSFVKNDLKGDPRVVSADLMGESAHLSSSDLLNRSLIRHDKESLAVVLMKIIRGTVDAMSV